MADRWEELSFIGNFAAFADALGTDGLGIAWGAANIPFPSIGEREKFINALVMMPRNGQQMNLVSQSQAPLAYPTGGSQ